MQVVGKFSLINQGGFVCYLQFRYLDDNGNFILTPNKSDKLLLGQTQVDDPTASPFSVPDGSTIGLSVNVDAGSNNFAQQLFVLQKGSTNVASYVIAGTTLSNQLGLVSVGPGKS